jgi:hypothetical protein
MRPTMYSDNADIHHSRSAPPHTTLVILQKFLRANEGQLLGAKAQLLAALKWRKSYNPLAAKDEVFSKAKFGGLGYVTKVRGAMLGAQKSGNEEDVVVFNIYGAAAKNSKETFGDTDAYVVNYKTLLGDLHRLTAQQVRTLESGSDGAHARPSGPSER